MALRAYHPQTVSCARNLQVDVGMVCVVRAKTQLIAPKIVPPNAIQTVPDAPPVNLSDARREALGKIRCPAKRAAHALKLMAVQAV